MVRPDRFHASTTNLLNTRPQRWLSRSRSSGLLGMLVLAATSLLLAPRAAAEGSTQFSHEAWGQVLERFVDDQGLVDYQGLAEEPAELERYLEAIATTGPANRPDLFPDSDHQLAYYINAYNALVFEGVLAQGPKLDTVWGWTGTGAHFFGIMKVAVEGRSMTVKKLEDDIVRARYADPRIHAALNCASLGCPRLPREPFLGAMLDQQLDAAMREFVDESGNVKLDSKAGTLTLSKIFDWFREDFLAFEREQGEQSPSLIGYINRYRPAAKSLPEDLELRFADYDKRLNVQHSR